MRTFGEKKLDIVPELWDYNITKSKQKKLNNVQKGQTT